MLPCLTPEGNAGPQGHPTRGGDPTYGGTGQGKFMASRPNLFPWGATRQSHKQRPVTPVVVVTVVEVQQLQQRVK